MPMTVSRRNVHSPAMKQLLDLALNDLLGGPESGSRTQDASGHVQGLETCLLHAPEGKGPTATVSPDGPVPDTATRSRAAGIVGAATAPSVRSQSAMKRSQPSDGDRSAFFC